MRHKLFNVLLGLALPILGTAFFLTGCTTGDDVHSPNDSLTERSPILSSGINNTRVKFIGLSPDNELVFLSLDPYAVETGVVSVTGLRGPEERLIAIDKVIGDPNGFPTTNEPADRGLLYGLSDDGLLYRIEEISGQATLISAQPLDPSPIGKMTGFDYDNLSGELRIITDAGEDLRVDPVTGRVVGIGPNTLAGRATVNAIGVAYEPGAAISSLYLIDVMNNRLLWEPKYGQGYYIPIGETGFTFSGEGGLEVYRNQVGYSVQLSSSQRNLAATYNNFDDTTEEAYRLLTIDLRSGRANSLGKTRELIGLTQQ